MADLRQLLSLMQAPRKPQNGFDPNYLNDESIDPSVRADAGAGAMQGELRDRLFQAERTQGPGPAATPHAEVQALSRMLGSYDAQRASSPLVGQQATVDAQNAGNLESVNQGFAGGPGQSPMQAREIYKRQLGEEKMRQPIQERSMIESGENFRQGRAIDSQRENTTLQMAPRNREVDLAEQYQDALLKNNPNMGNVRGFNKYGPQFQTSKPPGQVTPQMAQAMRDLANARNNMGGVDPFANVSAATPQSNFFWQNARNTLANSGLQLSTQNALYDYLSDPHAPPFEEAFGEFANDREYPLLRQIALLIKGDISAAPGQ